MRGDELAHEAPSDALFVYGAAGRHYRAIVSVDSFTFTATPSGNGKSRTAMAMHQLMDFGHSNVEARRCKLKAPKSSLCKLDEVQT